jgi:D,D-heptose 1,7-bisphosphate phosphatase
MKKPSSSADSESDPPLRRPAVFLDRDGTLNVDRSYLTAPDQLQLLPGVSAALKQLRSAGFACVVVTNQSAVGRGMMTDAALASIHEEMNRQLALEEAELDGIYACLHAPASNDPLAVDHPERKPAPGMLLRAAAEMRLDLARSWMIGDTLRDILAGQNAGCQGCILVRTGHPVDETSFHRVKPFVVVDDLLTAARFILQHESPDKDLAR